MQERDDAALLEYEALRLQTQRARSNPAIGTAAMPGSRVRTGA